MKSIKTTHKAEKKVLLMFYVGKFPVLNHLKTLVIILYMLLLEKEVYIIIQLECHIHEDQP